MKLPTVLLAIAAFVGIVAFAKKKAADLLNFNISGLDAHFDGYTPVITVNVAVQNPTNESFHVRAITGNLSANDYNIGTVTNFNSATIPPASQVIYPLDIHVSLFGIIADLWNAIKGSGFSQKIKFDGIVNVDGVAIPLTINRKIG